MASVQTIAPKMRKTPKVPECFIKEVLDVLPVYYIPDLQKEGIVLE